MPSGKRIGKLDTIESISIEYRRIYRLCRNEKMPLAEGKGYCWLLVQLSKIISDSDFEKRLEKLENEQA